MRDRHRRGAGMMLHLAMLALIALMTLPGPAPAATVDHFSAGLSPGLGIAGVALGPDSNLWFTGEATSKIGRITPAGEVVEYDTPTPAATPRSIVLGPDGNLWATLMSEGKLARVTPAGVVEEKAILAPGGQPDGLVNGGNGLLYYTIRNQRKIGAMLASPPFTATEYALPDGPGEPFQIALGPDGNLWFTFLGAQQIGRMTLDGVFLPPITAGICAGSALIDLVAGPDGNMWYACQAGELLGRITPAGNVAGFPTGGAQPNFIALGPEGNLWFTSVNGRVGRMTPEGQVTEFPGFEGELREIAVGADGALWIAELGANRIGRVTTETPPVVVTGVADGVTATQAQVQGTVTPSGLPTTWVVQYGTAPGTYSVTTPAVPAGTGVIPAQIKATLGGLTPATTYYFRLSAQNASGVATGAEGSFTTPAAPPTADPPTVDPPKTTPLRPVSARVRHRAIPVAGRGIRLTRLRVTAPRASRVTVRCRAACGARRITIARGTTANFDTLFRRRVLRPGSTIGITVTRRGSLGRTYTLRVTRRGLTGRACILRGTPAKPKSCAPYRLS